jgi:hypothetical protein
MLDRALFSRAIELYGELWAQAIRRDHPEARLDWIGSQFEDISPFHVVNIHDLELEDLCWAIEAMARLHQYAPLNGDHRLLWSWCVQTCTTSERTLGPEWVDAFRQASLLISAMSGSLRFYSAIEPLLYALLEGGLRRVLPDWVATDGRAKKDIRTSFGKKKRGERVNRIGSLIELLIKQREHVGSPQFSAVLHSMEERFGTEPPMAHQIDNWRCELLHGEEFSRQRAPYLMDLLTLLLICTADNVAFDAEKASTKSYPLHGAV